MLNLESLRKAQEAHERFIKDKMKYLKYRQDTVWTLTECKKDAMQYQSKNEWKEANYTAYNRACYNGWLGECCAHMAKTAKKRQQRKPVITYEEVMAVIPLVKNYKQFRVEYEKYYLWGLRNNFGQKFKEMIKQNIEARQRG